MDISHLLPFLFRRHSGPNSRLSLLSSEYSMELVILHSPKYLASCYSAFGPTVINRNASIVSRITQRVTHSLLRLTVVAGAELYSSYTQTASAASGHLGPRILAGIQVILHMELSDSPGDSCYDCLRRSQRVRLLHLPYKSAR